MTRELMSLAGGKIVLVLEGGYDQTGICDCSEMCLTALLGEELPGVAEEELNRSPCKPALETLESTINIQQGMVLLNFYITPRWDFNVSMFCFCF